MRGMRQKRVVAYIDGFNLYYGLRAGGYNRYYWLDLSALARNLLKPNQSLAFTKYFTARIAGAKPADSPAKARRLADKRKRQLIYLDALATLRSFQIYEGHYLAKDVRCHRCGAEWTTHEEKMTDVNIATELLVDAFNGLFDVALVISADSDLVSPVLAVREHFPERRIVVAFPPKRQSIQLRQAASVCFPIGRGKLKQSQLPDSILTDTGYELRRPTQWR